MGALVDSMAVVDSPRNGGRPRLGGGMLGHTCLDCAGGTVNDAGHDPTGEADHQGKEVANSQHHWGRLLAVLDLYRRPGSARHPRAW